MQQRRRYAGRDMTLVNERRAGQALPTPGVAASRSAIVAVGAWAVLVAATAGSLVGGAQLRGGVRVLMPVAVGIGVVAFARHAALLRWRVLLAVVVMIAVAWAVSLALVDGPGGLTRPLESRYDYLHDVPLVGESPRAFLGSFSEQIRTFTTHVQGHPPAMLLTLWTLDRIGAGGAGWAAGLVIVTGASAAAATLVAMRQLAGEDVARRAAPFLALMPAAVWIATSADALFLGVSAWGVALLVLATGPSGLRSDIQALGGGLLLGGALFLTYGVVPLAAVPIAVAVSRRRLRPLAVAAAGVAIVAAAFAFAGFWWLDGLRATAERYAAGAARHRPYARSLVTNLGAFAVALGPAAVVALARLRDRRVWLLAGGAIGAVVVADLSGLSKGEVERIWLPFLPWVLTACVVLRARGWLALQAGAGFIVQVVLRSPW